MPAELTHGLRQRQASRHELTPTDCHLIDTLHGGFPLTDQPFARVGDALGLTEQDVLHRLTRLLEQRILTRFGPLFDIARLGGEFVLAALAVPEERFEDVAALVNALPAVAHNYQRTHTLNMWFVLAGEHAAAIQQAILEIEKLTGLTVFPFPKEREFFVELRLPASTDGFLPPMLGISDADTKISLQCSSNQDSSLKKSIILATQGGIPLVSRPWHAIANQLGISVAQLRGTLSEMLQHREIRRIGAVPNHYALGYTLNGMTVWDVADEQVDALGERIGQLPFVSHAYRRPRALPQWRYNLFAMVHGRHPEQVEQQIAILRDTLGSACRAHDTLYSTRILKKTGLRLGV